MSSPLEILKSYWGYASFRPLQQKVIEEVIAGQDLLVLMPTGGGKSITFQVPGLMMDGICLVVSPLISLIKDQVHQLRNRKISAEYLVSGMDFREIDRYWTIAFTAKSSFYMFRPSD
jgi:ATP-dependent DNA helicase RecQ